MLERISARSVWIADKDMILGEKSVRPGNYLLHEDYGTALAWSSLHRGSNHWKPELIHETSMLTGGEVVVYFKDMDHEVNKFANELRVLIPDSRLSDGTPRVWSDTKQNDMRVFV